MAKERERKFLVKKEFLPKLDRGKRITQGYLTASQCGVTIRVRMVQHAKKQLCYITIKGPPTGNVRDEFEYRIPAKDAKQLMLLCGDTFVTKIRHKIGGWEIDEYEGSLKGLFIAEYEFDGVEEELPSSPKWLGDEVSNVWAYSNAFLATCK